MKIRCKIEREGGSDIDIDGTHYLFEPNKKGHHVATVENEEHIGRFLSITQGYEVYDAEGMSKDKQQSLVTASIEKYSAPAQTEPIQDDEEDNDADEDDGDSALVGSDVLDTIVKIGDADVDISVVVTAAFEDSGMTTDEWNALVDEDRETRIATKLTAMQEDASKKK